MYKIGTKGKQMQYPKYAPHIILGTNISILDVIYGKTKILKRSLL